MNTKIDISVVIPVYQAEDSVNILTERLIETLNSIGLNFEIILVDDGSRDNSWKLIKDKTQLHNFVKGIKLSRNFGQHNAISAGLSHSLGNKVVVMDCDLQDLPEEIPKLYQKALEGFDIVVGQRKKRMDNKFKIWTSKIFFKIFEKFTGLSFEAGTGNFGIYSKKVIDGVLMFHEGFRPFPVIVRTIGFKRTGIEIRHASRIMGRSNYKNFNLLKFALNTILYYSNKPIWMFLIGGLGMVAFIFSLVLGTIFLTFEITTLQLIIALIGLISFISLNIAVVGIYVSRIFLEIKNRPFYIIDELILNNND